MVDKKKKNAYIWYSSATDVTGKKLADALGIEHGSKKPATKDVDLVIGWGTKNDDKVTMSSTALNHPDKIKINRDKLSSLQLMKNAGVNVAPFCTDVTEAGMKKAKVSLPMIGRTRYHQGGKGFWNCPTMSHVVAASKEGADYFQNLIEIKDEYRLHVFGDSVIYAVKKVQRTVEEIEEAYIKQEMDRQIALGEKNNDKLDKATMEKMLRRQAKKFAQDGANMLIRSNRLGWKFCKVTSYNKKMAEEAVKALQAIGLDFGAVDCCTDVKSIPYILEVNTGPGLEETSFDIWVSAFQKRINDILSPKTETPKKVLKTDIVAKPMDTKLIGKSASSARIKLAERIKLMNEMVDNADDEDVPVLDKVFKKIFG